MIGLVFDATIPALNPSLAKPGPTFCGFKRHATTCLSRLDHSSLRIDINAVVSCSGQG